MKMSTSCCLLSSWKKAAGPDGISSHMLQHTSHSIAEFLTKLFNKFLSLGSVPNVWKLSNVSPVYKTGDPSNVYNYYPISLLSLILQTDINTITNWMSSAGLFLNSSETRFLLLSEAPLQSHSIPHLKLLLLYLGPYICHLHQPVGVCSEIYAQLDFI